MAHAYRRPFWATEIAYCRTLENMKQMQIQGLEIVLGLLKEVMTSDHVENSIQAETYYDILTQSARHLSRFDPDVISGDFDPLTDDVESLIDDTIGRAFMFIELADNGESHVWYDRVVGMPQGNNHGFN